MLASIIFLYDYTVSHNKFVNICMFLRSNARQCFNCHWSVFIKYTRRNIYLYCSLIRPSSLLDAAPLRLSDRLKPAADCKIKGCTGLPPALQSPPSQCEICCNSSINILTIKIWIIDTSNNPYEERSFTNLYWEQDCEYIEF